MKTYNETNNYYGLQYEHITQNKEGYISKTGWLCISDNLKEQISVPNIRWEKGNSNGGTKEKWKSKFETSVKAFEELKKNGFKFIFLKKSQ